MDSQPTEPTVDLIRSLRRPDLSILGNAILALPPTQWQDRMFFINAPDTELKAVTGVFPATYRPNKSTHPLYILRAGSTGHLACPCSSKGHGQRNRFIASGCRLEMKEAVIDRDSFLLEQYRFTLPLDHRLYKAVRFFGRVPESCLRDCRRNR